VFSYKAADGSQLMNIALTAGVAATNATTFQAHDPVAGNAGTQCTGTPANSDLDCPAAVPPTASPDGVSMPDGDVVIWPFLDPYVVPVYVYGVPQQCATNSNRMAFSSRGNCPPFDYVAEKQFPLPVAMHVSGADVSDPAALIIYTHTSLSGTQLVDAVHADLHGNAVLNMRSGGQVTDVQGNQVPYTFTFFLGVAGLDSLANNPVPPNPSPGAQDTFNLSFAGSGWPANLASIFGSYGTDDRNRSTGDTSNQPGDSEQTETSYYDTSGNLEGLLVSLDDTNTPLGYLVLPTVTPAADLTVDPSQFRTPTTFDVLLSQPPARPPTSLPGGMAPTVNVTHTIVTTIRVGHGGGDYDDGPSQSFVSQYTTGHDFPDPLPASKHFVPSVPSGWAENSLVAITSRFNETQSVTQTTGGLQTSYAETISEGEFYRNRLARLTHALTIDTDDMIPYIGSFTVDSTLPLQPIFNFATARPMTGDGGSLRMAVAIANQSAKSQLLATFVFPPGSASFQIPALPAVIAQTLPQSWDGYQQLAISLSGYIRQATSLGSYKAFKAAYPFIAAPQNIELDANAPAAGQKATDRLLFFNYAFRYSQTMVQQN
jgi:hypothetical protein